MKPIPLPLIPSRLQQIYDSLPTIDCKGLCWRDCSIVLMSSLERTRMIAARGKGEAFLQKTGHCPMLDKKTHRCVVHEYRPFICRLYGVARGLQCEHGCIVHGKLLTHDEAIALSEEIEALGGGIDMFAPLPAMAKKGLREPASYRMVKGRVARR